MHVMFVSTEAVPFAKVGGMADVVGSLPNELQRQGIDARVILPGYGFINHKRYNIRHIFSYKQTLHEGTADVHVYTTTYDGVPYYFVQTWPFFGQEDSVYTQWDWDAPRFIAYDMVVMGTIWQIGERFGWFPDVMHANDWHTGLIPFFMELNRHEPRWRTVASVLSIHNLKYQGDHIGGWAFKAGVPGRHHPDLVYQDLTDNMMAIAIAHSDIVSTVSPRYAIEIQYPHMGYGLQGLIQRRMSNLFGILNGIDADLWNPETDKKIQCNYNAETFEELRIYNKRYLQKQLGLDVRDDVMVIGAVTRLVWQKGLDMAIPALRRILEETSDVQIVILGTGDPGIEHELWTLERDFGWRVRAILQYDGAVAQQIYAGCDLFLMPSHFEPCGMGQMIAMRYGALPLVRETGGLADTVTNYDNADGEVGTGFVFSWEETDAVLGTLRWALDTFRTRPHAWRAMQKRAMEIDFSWSNSARQYIDLYSRAIQRAKEKG